MEVHRQLGPGFVESIYQQSLLRELTLRGLSTETEVRFDITYKGAIVGRHRLDVVVEKCVIIELKAAAAIADAHRAQALSYLKATGYELALILNFGTEKLTWKRLAMGRELRELV